MGLTVWTNFCCDVERDKDILEALGSVRNKSDYIRQALRFYLSQPSRADIIEAIWDLEAEVRRLRLSGVRPVEAASDEPVEADEPEEAARNLDGLMARLEAGVLDGPSNFDSNS